MPYLFDANVPIAVTGAYLVALASRHDGCQLTTLDEALATLSPEDRAKAEAAARTSTVADDAAPLVEGRASADWDAGAAEAPVAALGGIASWLGEIFGTARGAGQGHLA